MMKNLFMMVVIQIFLNREIHVMSLLSLSCTTCSDVELDRLTVRGSDVTCT